VGDTHCVIGGEDHSETVCSEHCDGKVRLGGPQRVGFSGDAGGPDSCHLVAVDLVDHGPIPGNPESPGKP
jgi:hypothetical protein